LRVLLCGLSGRGFPAGDGAAEAVALLPRLGVEIEYSHGTDPALGDKLCKQYDIAIIANTRIGAMLQADRRIWTAAKQTAYWFHDLRPSSVGAPLRGRVSHVFLTYKGRWLSPEGVIYDSTQWGAATGAKVGYAPQASPLRTPTPAPGGPRIVFVGDLANRTYHQGRGELCRRLGVEVVNAKKREERLAIEARLPTLYPSARYVLSTSPLAPGYTSVRSYSILACGGLMLLQRFPGAEELFTDGENAVLFDKPADLLPRLAELDQDEAARQRIAAAGRLLHATNHTLSHRVLTICRQVVGC
jgi:hypothetical protein